MPDTRSTEQIPEFPGRTSAVRLGAALLVALFLVLILAARDNGRRTALETTAEYTAVGDTHYFPMPEKHLLPPFPVVAALPGVSLAPADYRRHEFSADDMTRVGVESATGCIVYRAPERAKDQDDRKLGPIYYLKLSATEYLKTRESQATAGPN